MKLTIIWGLPSIDAIMFYLGSYFCDLCLTPFLEYSISRSFQVVLFKNLHAENELIGWKQGWYQSINELILPPLREPDALKAHVEQCFTSLSLDRDLSSMCLPWQHVSIVFWIPYTRCRIVFSPEETRIHNRVKMAFAILNEYKRHNT